jgi:hypothetical protein
MVYDILFLLRLQKSYSILFEDGLGEGRPVAVAAPAFNQLDAYIAAGCLFDSGTGHSCPLGYFFVVFPKV